MEVRLVFCSKDSVSEKRSIHDCCDSCITTCKAHNSRLTQILLTHQTSSSIKQEARRGSFVNTVNSKASTQQQNNTTTHLIQSHQAYL